MQFPKKNPDFEITCLDGIVKVHRFLVENITDYFTHEKPFLECNMVIINYVMDVLYYDIHHKNIGEYKFTTMDTTSIVKVCDILNINDDVYKRILSTMFREDIYSDVKNDMLNSFCIIINRFPVLLHTFLRSNLVKSKGCKGDIKFDLLRQLTKNAIIVEAVETLKPIFEICDAQTLGILANEFREIIDPNLIGITTFMYIIEHQCSVSLIFDLYDSLLIDKLQASEIMNADADVGPVFAAIAKRLGYVEKNPKTTKIINVCTLLGKLK